MTQKQKQTIEQALARAIREGIRIVAKLGTPESPIFYTTSSAGGETNLYRVTCNGQQLTCNCKASGICKHRAICHEALKEERQEATPAAVIATSEDEGLEELLDRDTTADEWEPLTAEEIAEIDRRIEAQRAETAAEIEREAAKKRATALPADTFDYQTMLAAMEPDFSGDAHDSRPMKWNQAKGCYEVISQEEIARKDAVVAAQKAAMRSGVQARQSEEW